MGSGAGEATKPSELLMRVTVAEFTDGPTVQLDPPPPDEGKQHKKSLGPGQRPTGELAMINL